MIIRDERKKEETVKSRKNVLKKKGRVCVDRKNMRKE